MARRSASWVVVVAAAAYVAIASRWIAAPLGLSHDGRNTAMFSLGARALARMGIVDSHAGAVLANGNGSYAHHPPSLVWAIRASHAVFGDGAWASRLPTVAASLAVIWLLWRLLQDLGLRPMSAAIGTAVAVANPMFLVFAWMADTPMWCLPFALIATRAWVRAGDAPTRGVLVVAGVAAAACGLSGWQGAAWCGLLAVAGWRRSRTLVAALAAGLVVGLAGTGAWIAASPAGIDGIVDAFSMRAAGEGQGIGVGDAVAANWTYVRQLWSPLVVVVGLGALWVAARDRRVRGVLAVAVAGVVAYAAVFWHAAAIHSYWNLWAVVAVALAFGAIADRVATTSLRVVGTVTAVGLVMILAGFQPSDARSQLERGTELGRAVVDTTLPADQPGWLLSGLEGSEGWVSYATDRPARVVADRSRLVELARRHPDWMIVLPCAFDETDACAAMGRGGTVVNGVAVNRLESVVVALP